uniref:HMG box domain-containing protein n=1 Tax=Entomoneis paludosa TaxID=265537 RepID=A0A7S3DVI7_9STRA
MNNTNDKSNLDRPKRPLSAYNLYFRDKRQDLLKQRLQEDPSRKIGFANMAKTIAAGWNSIDPLSKKHYESLARVEKFSYKKAMTEWKKQERNLKKVQKKKNQVASLKASSTTLEAIPSTNVAKNTEQAEDVTERRVSWTPSCVGSAAIDQLTLIQQQEKLDDASSISFCSDLFFDDTPLPVADVQMSGASCAPQSHNDLASRHGIERLSNRLDDDCVDWLVGLFQS